MSETAAERSKRQYLTTHRSQQWTHQHSIFYATPEESVGLLDHMVAFKQHLRRKASDQPFLIRIQLRNKASTPQGPSPLQAYLTMYTAVEVANLKAIAEKAFPVEMNVRGRALTPGKLESSALSIEKQKPHNLNNFFGKAAVKRWSVLNKDLIDPSLRYKDSSEW